MNDMTTMTTKEKKKKKKTRRRKDEDEEEKELRNSLLEIDDQLLQLAKRKMEIDDQIAQLGKEKVNVQRSLRSSYENKRAKVALDFTTKATERNVELKLKRFQNLLEISCFTIT